MGQGWIHSEERMPTQDDADKWGCVLVWHTYQGPMITGWKQVKQNSFMTHWRRTPRPPACYRDPHKERP